MPIGPTSGFLDFTNATPRANVIVALSNIGIGTDVPLHALDLRGTANVADIIINNDLTLTGGLTTNSLTINSMSMSTTSNFQQVTNVGNVTTNTVEFTNPTTGLTVTSNAEVGGELSVSGGATVSGNVGVGTTEPTETLDIVGNLNLQKVSNTASIKLNSNVVTEYTRSKKLIKYPRVAMTAATTAGYTVSASSIYSSGNYPPYEAFNNIFPPGDDSALEGWISSGSRYSTTATNGEYLADGTDTFSGAPSGEQDGSWIKLQLPIKIKLSHLVLKQRLGGQGQEYSKNVVVYASVDNSSWHSLGTFDPSGSETFTFYTNTSHYYDYFVLHVKSVNHQYTYTAIEELEYYGVPEYDPDADGTDVIVKSVPNVPNTDWLKVYWDGQDYTSMPTTVTDKSGNEVAGTHSGGVGFDTEYKAFTFDGVDDYIQGTVSGVSGDYIHSASLWIKPTGTNSTIFEISGSTRSANSVIGLYLDPDGTLAYYFYDNDARYDTNLSIGHWYHIGLTYYGNGTRRVYVNGLQSTFEKSSGTITNSLTLAGGTLTIGNVNDFTGSFFNGSIANFRLFNRALTSDEIWQLYAYQKEYFGLGNLDMTLKCGRLGIGTSEPRATLDIAGTFKCGNSPFKFYHIRGTHLSSVGNHAVPKPAGMSGDVISITGVTYNTNSDVVPFARHNDSATWETDVFYDTSASAFVINAQGTAVLGRLFSLFVVTL